MASASITWAEAAVEASLMLELEARRGTNTGALALRSDAALLVLLIAVVPREDLSLEDLPRTSSSRDWRVPLGAFRPGEGTGRTDLLPLALVGRLAEGRTGACFVAEAVPPALLRHGDGAGSFPLLSRVPVQSLQSPPFGGLIGGRARSSGLRRCLCPRCFRAGDAGPLSFGSFRSLGLSTGGTFGRTACLS